MDSHISPDKWGETPIVLPFNPKTGYNLGEDGDKPEIGNPGYRGMKTLAENDEPLVIPAGVEDRSKFDGVDEYGRPNNDFLLPGGVKSETGAKVQIVRESAARLLDYAAKFLEQHFNDEYRMTLVDGFESHIRQGGGFTKILKQLLEEGKIQDPSLTELHTLGRKANGTYSWVKAQENSPAFLTLMSELKADPAAMQEAKALAEAALGGEGATPEAVSAKADEILTQLITISANSGIGPAKGRGVPMNFEHNAHAGGAAMDIMFIDKKGTLLNLVPYLWMGEEASMDYMEKDENYDRFVGVAKAQDLNGQKLRAHLAMIGYPTVEHFTFEKWKQLREVRRVRYHLLTTLGCTFYSAHNPAEGGEDWHYEPGNILYDANGQIIRKALTADQFPDSGNPGHTLQKVGPEGIAVYGGGSAHRIAQKNWGLELPEAA